MNPTIKSTFYLVKHKPSSSVAHITYNLDENGNIHLNKVNLISGKVISLDGVKKSLELFKQSQINPKQLA